MARVLNRFLRLVLCVVVGGAVVPTPALLLFTTRWHRRPVPPGEPGSFVLTYQGPVYSQAQSSKVYRRERSSRECSVRDAPYEGRFASEGIDGLGGATSETFRSGKARVPANDRLTAPNGLQVAGPRQRSTTTPPVEMQTTPYVATISPHCGHERKALRPERSTESIPSPRRELIVKEQPQNPLARFLHNRTISFR
jgi:hypothetical protein